MIYSTCTFAPQENEENIEWIAQQSGFETIRIDLEEDWGITEHSLSINQEEFYGYQFFPHKAEGEGFFLTCFRKKGKEGKPAKIKVKKRLKVERLPQKFLPQIGKWLKSIDDYEIVTLDERLYALPKTIFNDYKLLVNFLKLRMAGVELGKFAGKKLIPAHHLAVSHLVSDKVPRLELTYEQAIDYLRKQEVKAETGNISGWAIATYQHHSLGWLKVLPNRINNYYPMELRLRKEISFEN